MYGVDIAAVEISCGVGGAMATRFGGEVDAEITACVISLHEQEAAGTPYSMLYAPLVVFSNFRSTFHSSNTYFTLHL